MVCRLLVTNYLVQYDIHAAEFSYLILSLRGDWLIDWLLDLSVPLVVMRILFAHSAHSATVPRPATHYRV